MNVLIGFEESQKVCTEFRNIGHNAYSCDIQKTRGNQLWHLNMDIMKAIILMDWDLIILHPECTAMALCGNRWYGKGMSKNDERIAAINYTIKLWEFAKKHCDSVALENPKSVIFPLLRNAGEIVQYVQPWMFGHKENKETGFALYGLPELKETNNVKKLVDLMPKSETDKVHRMAPGPNRKRDRSETYLGIAAAMANQWG